jgi:hypothetical protein
MLPKLTNRTLFFQRYVSRDVIQIMAIAPMNHFNVGMSEGRVGWEVIWLFNHSSGNGGMPASYL